MVNTDSLLTLSPLDDPGRDGTLESSSITDSEKHSRQEVSVARAKRLLMQPTADPQLDYPVPSWPGQSAAKRPGRAGAPANQCHLRHSRPEPARTSPGRLHLADCLIANQPHCSSLQSEGMGGHPPAAPSARRHGTVSFSQIDKKFKFRIIYAYLIIFFCEIMFYCEDSLARRSQYLAWVRQARGNPSRRLGWL